MTHARLVAGPHEQIDHQILAIPEAAAPYSDLEQIPLTDEPSPVAPTFARFRVWMAAVSRTWVGLPPDRAWRRRGPARATRLPRRPRPAPHIWCLVRHCWHGHGFVSGHPLALIRAAAAAARTHRSGALCQLADRLAAGDPSPPGRRVFEDGVGWFPATAPVGWFTVETRRMLAERLREAAGQTAEPAGGVGDMVALAGLNRLARMSRTDAQMAGLLGVRLHDPFFDNAVVQACLDVTAAERTSPFRAKPLLHKALAGLGADAALDRCAKGDYTAAVHRGARRNARLLHGLLDDSLLADADIIDPAPLHAAVDQAAAQPIPSAFLDAIVAAEVWIRALRHIRPATWISASTESASTCVM